MKLKFKKGFMLIKVLISMSVFSIFFILIITMHIHNMKLEKENSHTYKIKCYIEAIKNEFLYNMDSEYIDGLKSKEHIVNRNNIGMDKLETVDLKQIISDDIADHNKYLKIIVSNDNIIEITMYDNNKSYYIKFKKGST